MNGYKKIDLAGGKWMSTGGRCCTPMIRRKLVLPQIKKAQITIASFGFFEVFINGKKVSEDLFLPLSTDYHERPESFTGAFHMTRKCAIVCIVRCMILLPM